MAKLGRPTKYNETLQEKADKYIVDCPDVVPSQVGLVCYLGISEPRIEVWRGKHPAFSRTLDEIKAQQHRQLLNGGLSGDQNSNIVKLMLHNHGYSDKSETKNENDNEISISIKHV